jgi:PAS domain-containing protein
VPDTSDIPAQNGSAPRLAAFYRALSAMNQAIAHVSDPMALYNRLCGIAVATCGARMAWIGLIGDGRVQPLAWAGEAAAYTRGLVIAQPRAGESDADLGPTAYALHSGQACICNDFHAEPRTVRFREWAARFGVKASGAFPIRRAGQVVGTLNLYFDAVGAFDAALVELVEQLVLDLCFALEHIDREAARALAERTARERELQLSAIVQSAMDAIISIDAQFNVVLFNDAAARMFGVPAAEAIGRPLDRCRPRWRRCTACTSRTMRAGASARGAWATRRWS